MTAERTFDWRPPTAERREGNRPFLLWLANAQQPEDQDDDEDHDKDADEGAVHPSDATPSRAPSCIFM